MIIEWQTTRNVGGVRFEWRGVDKFRIREGKIIEERVYSDTAPLRAFRKGETLEPITTLRSMIEASKDARPDWRPSSFATRANACPGLSRRTGSRLRACHRNHEAIVQRASPPAPHGPLRCFRAHTQAC